MEEGTSSRPTNPDDSGKTASELPHDTQGEQPAQAQSTGKRKRHRKNRAAEPAVGADSETDPWLAPWTESLRMTQYESKEQRLHDEIVAYATYIQPTTQERSIREQVIARVGEVVKGRFSDATLTVFGSVAHDLYFPDGDMDLVMSVPRQLEHGAKKKMLFQLSVALKDSLITHKVNVIHHARVPILSFETVADLGSFKIDISINASDGVAAVPLVGGYLKEMPALRHLILIVKALLAREQLNSAANGGLSSYSAICLAISFLQLNPKSRPAEFIQKPMEAESLGTLLMDFLDYYGNSFPYETSCISVREAKLCLKETKGWANPSQRNALSIECLVNPDHDIARSTGKIVRLRTVFRDAHVLLRDYPLSIDHKNALGAIVGVKEETIRYRRRLGELVDSGGLERALAAVRLPRAQSRQRRPMPGAASLPRKPQFAGPYPSDMSGRALPTHYALETSSLSYRGSDGYGAAQVGGGPIRPMPRSDRPPSNPGSGSGRPAKRYRQ